MEASISLKQLRTQPREYIRLLDKGYCVSITEHRKVLVKATRAEVSSDPKPGDTSIVLDAIDSLDVPDYTVAGETTALLKKAKLQILENKLSAG